MRAFQRLALGSIAAASAALAPSHANAQCLFANCQSDGAVQKPASFDVSLPFKEGENVYVLSGYGPSGGSGLHCRARDTNCANDWYALDLTLPDHPSSGKGQPVLAVADGTVLDAAWGSSGWANYGQRVYITHDFNADGHKYVSMYAHLDSIDVQKGQHVSKGDVIGKLGQSCQGALSCTSFSTPHLHFALHRDSNFGGSGSGGSYGGLAVIAEPIDGHSGLMPGQSLMSKNGQQTMPMPDCDLVIPPAETIIEDNSPCASLTAAPDGETNGHFGHSYFAQQDTPDPDYEQGMVWSLEFQLAGSYDVWAFVSQSVPNLSSAANYKVQHSGAANKVNVDQAAHAGEFAYVGRFDFAAGADQWVRLGDNFVDAANQGKNLSLDALKIAPAGSAPSDAGGVDAGIGPPDAGTPPGNDASSGNSATRSTAEDSGCGCTTAGHSAPSGVAWLGLMLLGGAGCCRRRALLARRFLV